MTGSLVFALRRAIGVDLKESFPVVLDNRVGRFRFSMANVSLQIPSFEMSNK